MRSVKEKTGVHQKVMVAQEVCKKLIKLKVDKNESMSSVINFLCDFYDERKPDHEPEVITYD